jgi:hypothetical protein
VLQRPATKCHDGKCECLIKSFEGKSKAIVTVGIDLAKNVLAVHGVDSAGKPVLVCPSGRQDRRRPATKRVRHSSRRHHQEPIDNARRTLDVIGHY